MATALNATRVVPRVARYKIQRIAQTKHQLRSLYHRFLINLRTHENTTAYLQDQVPHSAVRRYFHSCRPTLASDSDNLYRNGKRGQCSSLALLGHAPSGHHFITGCYFA